MRWNCNENAFLHLSCIKPRIKDDGHEMQGVTMMLYLPGIKSEKIVECVPNFSEGRNEETISEIVEAISSVPNVIVLDWTMDPNHNRAVVTFIGSPHAVVEAAFQATKVAAELIDLTKHHGEHPRFGATDVIPLVPVNGMTIEECIQLARELGNRIGNELGIPVYLYEKAAQKPERVNLANIRNKNRQFEQLQELISKDPKWMPDFGPPRVHPTAGATIIGVRNILVAYNVQLGTKNVEIAKKIARNVRFSGGGLRYVKALGFELKDQEKVQVSMNMVNVEGTPLHQVFELIKIEADRYGVPVVGSEIVGLLPLQALLDTANFYLRLDEHPSAHVLELKILEKISSKPLSLKNGSLSFLLNELASSSSLLGNETVATLNGMLAAAMLEKAIHASKRKGVTREVEEKLTQVLEELFTIQEKFMELLDGHGFVFNMSRKKSIREKEDSAMTNHDEASKHESPKNLALPRVLLDVARSCHHVLHLLKKSLPFIKENALDELFGATMNARTGAELAIYLTRKNLKHLLKDEDRQVVVEELDYLEEEIRSVSSTLLSRSNSPNRDAS